MKALSNVHFFIFLMVNLVYKKKFIIFDGELWPGLGFVRYALSI